MEEIEDKSGFYKWDEEESQWLYAHYWVKNKDYQLYRELKDTYTYPVDGWSWYDDEPK